MQMIAFRVFCIRNKGGEMFFDKEKWECINGKKVGKLKVRSDYQREKSLN